MIDVLEYTKILIPVIILTISALLVMVVEVLFSEALKRIVSFCLSILAIFLALVVLLIQAFEIGSSEVMIFGGSLLIDKWAIGFSIVIVLGAFMVLVASYDYIGRINSKLGEYYSLILFAVVGMIFLVMSNDMMTFFISFEVMSIAVFVLAGFNVVNIRSNESAFKYFILGVFATAFMIMGIAFIYGATGEMRFQEISHILVGIDGVDYYFGLFGLGLILVGFLFKVGTFPFHQWIPDVYEGAPTSVTAFMSTVVKVAGFAIIIRVLFIVFSYEAYSEKWINILTVVSILTMIAGNFMALVQDNIKRLLAYSGIAHSGYILLAVIAAKVGGGDISPVIFYLLTYTIMTIGAFVVLIGAGDKGCDVENIDEIRGLGYKNKFLGFSMSFFFFSLAGIPSTAGFMAKFFIFKSVIGSGLYMLAVIGILTAIVSVYYYIRVVVYLYMKDEASNFTYHKPSFGYSFITFMAIILTFLFGILPQFGFYFLHI